MQWRHWRLSRRKPSNYILLTDQVLVMLKCYFRTSVAHSIFLWYLTLCGWETQKYTLRTTFEVSVEGLDEFLGRFPIFPRIHISTSVPQLDLSAQRTQFFLLIGTTTSGTFAFGNQFSPQPHHYITPHHPQIDPISPK
jgi:hypothetical protein